MGAMLAFTTKTLILLLLVGAVIAVMGVLGAALVEGVAAGLVDITQAVSSASSFLTVGAGIAVGIVVVYLAAKILAAQRRGGSSRDAGAQTGTQPLPQGDASFQAPVHVPATPPDWYPDPSNPAQIRYWNGIEWTDHVRPEPSTAARPPEGRFQVGPEEPQPRYGNGTTWIEHAAPSNPVSRSSSVHPHSSTPRVDGSGVAMSPEEWQRHFLAWLTAGAVQQELWRRLVSSTIHDGDPVILEAQRQMELLGPQRGAQQLRTMLEANPGLREDLVASNILSAFLRGMVAPERTRRAGLEDLQRRGMDGR